MADIAKSGRPSLATLEPGYEHQLNNLTAGEALDYGDMCYIASTGRVMKTSGASANAAALYDGIVLQAAAIGDGVSLHHGVVVNYGSGLTPGARYYISGATAGALADAASTGGTTVAAKAVDASRVLILSPGR